MRVSERFQRGFREVSERCKGVFREVSGRQQGWCGCDVVAGAEWGRWVVCVTMGLDGLL